MAGTNASKAFGTDKSFGYLTHYRRWFAEAFSQPVTLLELGVFKGESLLMWLELFPRATVVGLDLSPPQMPAHPRLRLYAGDQSNPALLDEIARVTAPDGFDIVIDDASHIGALTRASFRKLFLDHLKPGGLYVIEDWGTGYWGDWPDGLRFAGDPSIEGIAKQSPPGHHSHSAGMVGVVKDLVDEVGIADITHSSQGGVGTPRRPLIARLEIVPGIVLVEKSA